MKWLTIDPGETTGWALWEDNRCVDFGMDPMDAFIEMLQDSCYVVGGDYPHNGGPWHGIGAIVCEDWALYPDKLPSLGWDKCRTARAIGKIELIARNAGIGLVLQPAAIKTKALAAAAEGIFASPRHENRHSNDAKMHGVYWLAQNGQRPPG